MSPAAGDRGPTLPRGVSRVSWLQPEFEEGAGEGEGPLGVAGGMPVRFLIKFFLEPCV